MVNCVYEVVIPQLDDEVKAKVFNLFYHPLLTWPCNKENQRFHDSQTTSCRQPPFLFNLATQYHHPLSPRPSTEGRNPWEKPSPQIKMSLPATRQSIPPIQHVLESEGQQVKGLLGLISTLARSSAHASAERTTPWTDGDVGCPVCRSSIHPSIHPSTIPHPTNTPLIAFDGKSIMTTILTKLSNNHLYIPSINQPRFLVFRHG
ncbi:hypothetical protein VTJ04DRAFT_4547 [Mycothermus thermophilus]|uniref:uncharacterized protein n=1 Tax=Humicola insolens TaxID=85995 RepID=UPI0037425408